jgi:hypothetical protein
LKKNVGHFLVLKVWKKWRLAERSEAKRKWKAGGGAQQSREKMTGGKTSWMRQGNLEQQKSRSFFSAKRLKKKLGHFLVQKDWRKSWVTF